MFDNIADQIVNALLDWLFTLLYGLLIAVLKVVDFIASFFDVFAGTSKIIYNGDADFLLNVFIGHDAVTNSFWAMALIAVVLAFGFCIFNVSRKVTDVTGTVKQSLGQIMSQFFRCLLIIVLLNAMLVAAVNITNVLLDRINYALLNAEHLDEDKGGREFTEQEYATMAKVLATVGNYSVNPSADSRYNINSCYNAVRGDLQALQATGVFDYTYDLTSSGHHTWQSALSMLANASDLTRDLSLDVYDENVAQAILTISDELKNNPNFRPLQSVSIPIGSSTGIDTDTLLFLIVGMNAANNERYNTGNLYDSLRNGYITGEKDYVDITQVKKDFNLQKIDYFVGYIAAVVFVIIMAICIFTFIVRLFNILLLYITAPLYVSSMPLDEGSKFQSWLQAFVIQLFSGFGQIIAMRLYLIVIPIIVSDDLIFFAGDGLWISTLNWFARLLMILGGAWAVLKAGGLVSSILSGNPGMHAAQQEAAMGGLVTRGARSALATTVSLVKGIGTAALKLPKGVQNVATAPAKVVGAVQKWGHGFSDPYHAIGDRRRARKEETEKRKASKEKWAEKKKDAPSSDQAGGRVPYEQTGGNQPSNQTAGDGRNRPTASSDQAEKKVQVPDYPKPPPLDIWDQSSQEKSREKRRNTERDSDSQ